MRHQERANGLKQGAAAGRRLGMRGLHQASEERRDLPRGVEDDLRRGSIPFRQEREQVQTIPIRQADVEHDHVESLVTDPLCRESF